MELGGLNDAFMYIYKILQMEWVNQDFLKSTSHMLGGWEIREAHQFHPPFPEQPEPRQVMLPSTLLWRPCGGKATGIGSTNPEVAERVLHRTG